MSWWPLNDRWGRDLASRRTELFKLAAPEFRQYGYRGATIKALAHACHLSPSALYHWFPSKAASATCLPRPAAKRLGCLAAGPDVSPLDQLAIVVELSIEELPDYLLAIELARELGRPLSGEQLGDVFEEGEALLGRLIAAAVPTQGEAAARELARRLLAILVAPHVTGLDPSLTAVRPSRRPPAFHLLPAGIDPVAFDRAMTRG
ncbi:MAG TPA: helix-turn-helix domain-containing protein [Candidatus Limnocylindrales bacterium]